MKRKSKIIISVIGIILVSLILLGYTYGFYMSRFNGNENDESINLTTENLSLLYSDKSNELINSDVPIVPGEFKATKTFTVENDGTGDISAYAVVLDDYGILYALDDTLNGINAGDVTTLNSPDDFKLVMTCTAYTNYKEENQTVIDDGCVGIDGHLPESNQNEILVTNSIAVGVTHEYVLTLIYEETNEDQSADMNKIIKGKINIIDPINTIEVNGTVESTDIHSLKISSENPKLSYVLNGTYKVYGIAPDEHEMEMYNKEGTTLATQTFSMIKGATQGINGTDIIVNEATKALIIDINSSKELEIDKILSRLLKDNILANGAEIGTTFDESYNATASVVHTDIKTTADFTNISDGSVLTNAGLFNDGNNNIYFRGPILNNYVDFAENCWRIVNITNNGIKLILEDNDNSCKSSDGNWDIGIGYYGYVEEVASWNEIVSIKKQSYLNPSTNITSMTKSFKNFQTNDLNGYTDKLVVGNWCLNDKVYSDTTGTTEIDKETLYNSLAEELYTTGGYAYYDSYVRLINSKNPTFTCNGIVLTQFNDGTDMLVGTLTADEIVYAGGKTGSNNYKYYLRNGYNKHFWTISPNIYKGSSSDDTAVIVYNNGSMSSGSVAAYISYRPSVVLKTGITISDGNGTKGNPYIIES